MQLYPAIDMKNGQCVRLRQGAFKDITIYSDAPEKVAAHWQEKGASFLHLVDLDGALAGYSVNEEVIFLRDMVRTFGEEAIVAGVDAKDGMVAVEGWEKVSSLTASDLCLTMKEYGVRHIVYTDISRDGMLSGPNVEATRKLTEETGLDIIASGGVSCMEDLKCLHEAGIRGAIIGKALYENRIDLAEAVRLYEA